MKLQLYCDNNDCLKEESKRYMYEILIEAVMDVDNIAHIFCPRCKRVLKRAESV